MPGKSRAANYPTRRRWTEVEARGVLSALGESGLSLVQFARREGLDAQRLWRWQRRFAGEPSCGVCAPTFVELQASGTVTIEVVLRSGRVLRVPSGAEPAVVARLVAALDEV